MVWEQARGGVGGLKDIRGTEVDDSGVVLDLQGITINGARAATNIPRQLPTPSGNSLWLPRSDRQ